MTNVDEILNYKRKEEEDYYGILGCDETSTVEQITTEYKVRALQYHPDKNEGDKEAEQKFQLLKEAKETLCDPEKRSNYDKWRGSGISISYRQWLGMKEHVHQSMHWSTPKTKDRMLESGGSSGPSSLGAGGVSAAQRRASEGGANLHWTGRGGTGSAWGTEAPSESTQWTNLKTQDKILASGGSSGPSSLTAGVTPTAYRRASEGGPNLYMKLANKKAAEKNNEI
ncbi:J domain-containing protein isoform X1 [Zophobas morio]|uniref:J domain-containing protein isoform X1 n=1 Tax=Zophobas morio TaxID=2755281 RepID=UPI0030839533